MDVTIIDFINLITEIQKVRAAMNKSCDDLLENVRQIIVNSQDEGKDV